MTTALTMEIEEPPTKKTICSTKLIGRSNGGFVDLPAEIILIIFGFLAKSDLVHLAGSCTRFRILTKDSSLWKELGLDCQAFRNNFLCSFFKTVDSIYRLSISNKLMEDLPEDSIRAFILKYKHTLQHLALSDEVTVGSATIEQFKALKNLKSLHLFGTQMTKSGIAALSQLQNLQEIRIPGCEKVSSPDLCTLFSALKHLRVVDVSDCGPTVNTKVVTALASSNPGLEHLVLDESENVNSATLKPLAEHCKGLVHLSLEGCLGITDGSLVNLVASCRRLRFLSLGMCRGITCKSIKAMAANLPELRHLDLYACSFLREKSVGTLLAQCSNLEYINLRGIQLDTNFVEAQKKMYKERGLEIVFYAPETKRCRRGNGSPLQALQ